MTGLNPKDAALLQQMIDKVRALGVHVEGMRPRGSGLSALPWELVKVGGRTSGDGLYDGTIYRGWVQDQDVTATLDIFDLAGYVEAEACVVWNVGERGHAIANDTPVLGVLLGSTTDNKLIIGVSLPTGDGVCVLSQVGGANGTQSAAPTYTYTATDVRTGAELGVALTPEVSRPFGSVTAATRGVGYFNADGEYVLTHAFETPGSGACPDEGP